MDQEIKILICVMLWVSYCSGSKHVVWPATFFMIVLSAAHFSYRKMRDL